MTSTPNFLRQPPNRVFENYVFTRVVSPDVGLINIADEIFKPCSPGNPAEGGDPGTGYVSGGISNPLPLGFNFEIDGITYTRFCVSVNGWMALVDPVLGTFNSFEVIDGFNYQNDRIMTDFDSNAVLIAPWFAPNMRNVADDVQQLVNTGILISNDKADRVRKGLEPPPLQLNAMQNAVKYHNSDSPTGRRLIVRWNTLVFDGPLKPTTPGPGCRARFEVVLYENGTIEYRYEEKQFLKLTLSGSGDLESATIGIFMPGGGVGENGTIFRWRDFSIGLGYRDNERLPYKYGGYVGNLIYQDLAESSLDQGSQTRYTCNLKSSLHWPARRGMGALFTFAPPLARRRILPRNDVQKLALRQGWPTVARIAANGGNTSLIHYDDRKTITFTSGVVNYPTLLPRFYGTGEPGVIARQDLFAGDFQLTGSIVPAIADQYVGQGLVRYVTPFSEDKRFENAPSATSSFFATGSSIEQFGTGLSQPLKTKTQVRMGLRVNNKVQMLGLSASIYYYNSADNAWEIPFNSSYFSSGTSAVPSGNTNGDITNPRMYVDTINTITGVIEDGKGFGPIGNTLASGSNPLPGYPTDPYIINSRYGTTTSSFADVLDRTYPNSIQLNPKYEAIDRETFTLPINQPFLIEKAVIELPIAVGDKWFQNLTTTFTPITWLSGVAGDPPDFTTTGFDFAGPALTVALFNQVKVGNKTRRDLIMTGTITHALDNHAIIKLAREVPYSDAFQARPTGFRSYANPGAVVTPISTSAGYFFTGSVAVPCEAAVSNGIIIKWIRCQTGFAFFSGIRQVMRDTFASPEIDISNGGEGSLGFSDITSIAYVDPFGRSSAGFVPSGRSVLGQEFALLPASQKKPNRLPNPLYITGSIATKTGVDSGLPPQIEAAIGTGGNPIFFAGVVAAFLGGSRRSPYLVRPGDKLVLSISKMRPFFYGSTTPSTVSGSLNDDVTLNTGSINLTLYGCLLQEQQEINDTLNQPLVTDGIHEVIGTEPVLDQYEIAFRDEYVGGMFDDYITGSLIDQVIGPDGNVKLQTSASPRGRIFSAFTASTIPMLQYSGSAFKPPRTTGNQENITNPSKGFRLQPWFERIGTPRVLKMTSPSERMWDSLLPSFMECMATDGTGIAYTIPDISPIDRSHRVSGTFGYIYFDSHLISNPITNHRWTRSFPFEPHYSTATRLFDISTSFQATYFFDINTGLFNPIPPAPIVGFFIGIDRVGAPANPQALSTLFYGECNLAGTIFTDLGLGPGFQYDFFPTSSLGINDQVRIIYGVGDRRSINSSLGGVGPDKFAEVRDIGEFSLTALGDPTLGLHSENNRVGYGVVIRGWKYGILNGIPTFNASYWRQGRYGQFRDMLEQRPYTKFYHVPDPSVSGLSSISGQTTSVVTVKFINPTNNTITQAERTWSQNLSFEATSSLPYFDGDARNRGPIDTSTLNNSIVFITQGGDGQITL